MPQEKRARSILAIHAVCITALTTRQPFKAHSRSGKRNFAGCEMKFEDFSNTLQARRLESRHEPRYGSNCWLYPDDQGVRLTIVRKFEDRLRNCDAVVFGGGLRAARPLDVDHVSRGSILIFHLKAIPVRGN